MKKFIQSFLIAVAVLFLLIVILLVALIYISSLDDNIGTITEVYTSPTGEYQAEVVQISYGATGGESAVFVERKKEEPFPKVGENNTKKSIKVKETRSGWSGKYDVGWTSEKAFYVRVEDGQKRYYSVSMKGNKYELLEAIEID